MTAGSRECGGRRAAVAEFYAARAGEVERRVGARVRGVPWATVEDVCQFGWLSLLRRPDVTLDDRGVAWLVTVASREGWRLAHRPDDISNGAVSSVEGEGADPLERALEGEVHRARKASLWRLKPAERQAVGLAAVGCDYEEIASLTDATRTAVNRRLREGRARLRRGPDSRALGGELSSRAPMGL